MFISTKLVSLRMYLYSIKVEANEVENIYVQVYARELFLAYQENEHVHACTCML